MKIRELIEFRNEYILTEKVLSPGFNPNHNHYKERYRDQIYQILKRSYEKIGGYGGLGTGTDAEHHSIHHDISTMNMKMTRRNENITAVTLYKNQFGRKSIAAGTNGTKQGKEDLVKHMAEDNTQARAWAEVSDAPEHINRKTGTPEIPYHVARQIVGKPDMERVGDTNRYERSIGGNLKAKIAMGHPKLD